MKKNEKKIITVWYNDNYSKGKNEFCIEIKGIENVVSSKNSLRY